MTPSPIHEKAASEVVAENDLDPVRDAVQTIAELHKRVEGRLDTHQRSIERVTNLLGRPRFLYGTQVFVVFWLVGNLVLRARGASYYDEPPFYWLQGIVSLTALFVATVVLITQNRQGHTAERRAQLDLQMSILVEQKVSKLIALMEELRHDLPNVANRRDSEVEKLTETADVHAVVEALEEMLDEAERVVADEEAE